MNPEPNKIKQDAKLPNKKYFSPALVADSEFLYIVDRIYTANDCNSILKYIDIKFEEDINKLAPNVLNIISKQYSIVFLLLFSSIIEILAPSGLSITYTDKGLAINIAAPIMYINISNNGDIKVTGNNPL